MIEYVNRRGSDCYKWDSEHVRCYESTSPIDRQGEEVSSVSTSAETDNNAANDILPLWVADMDFKAAPAIIAALQRRLDHGVFGYQCVPQGYYDAISSWFSRRHGWQGITREQIIYTTGVVPAISAILRALSDMKAEQHSIKENGGLEQTTQPLRVITFTPAYNCFFSSISNIGCELVASPLVEQYSDKGLYFVPDWSLLEQQAASADVFLLCNPHNPTGRVWTRDELTRMADICRSSNVFVVSDEIHCEFTFPTVSYTPFAMVAGDNGLQSGESAVASLQYCVCISASKAFNIAGLQCANIFVPDADIRERINRAINIHEVCDIGPFGMTAMIAAYNESEAWLDELQQLLYDNYSFLVDFFSENMPSLQVTIMEGTYLAWINIRSLLCSSATSGLHSAETFCSALAQAEHVLLNPSEMYGSEGFIRINMATSRDNLSEALQRLCRFVRSLSA